MKELTEGSLPKMLVDIGYKILVLKWPIFCIVLFTPIRYHDCESDTIGLLQIKGADLINHPVVLCITF